MEKKVENALKWIIVILASKNIPYQIAGGFAAKLYGSIRPLNDIDMDIPDKNFSDIFDEVRQYIIYGPVHHKDRRWDCVLMTLEYQGQKIDISGGDTLKMDDEATNSWISGATDFSKSRMMEVFGMTIPVILPGELADYKALLEGDHQKEDIAAVRKWIYTHGNN